MFHGLSKSRLQAFRQCPRRLWLTVRRPNLQDVSAETVQRFQIGFQVGEIARSLHPDGTLIDTPDAGEALALTRQALAEHPDRPLFEAAFQRDGVLVRACCCRRRTATACARSRPAPASRTNIGRIARFRRG